MKKNSEAEPKQLQESESSTENEVSPEKSSPFEIDLLITLKKGTREYTKYPLYPI